ncbi:hypothetical protein Tco_1400175 [Tanacetum coccineum]
MDPNSSVGKTCLGENINEISSEKAEGHRDWNSPEYEDTANSGGKKETKALIFHKMDTEEISDRYVAPCFVNGLEAYDGEINLRTEENMISNEFAVKLCLEHEDLLLDDLDFGDILDIEGIEVPPLMCKIGKNSRNKRKQLEKYRLICSDIRPSLSTGKPLTHEEAKREALAIDICRRYYLLEEERPVIKTMAYNDKYKKILDGICIDKMKLDGERKKEEEEAIIRIKREALIEKEDPRAFVIPIRLEGTRQIRGDGCKKRNNNIKQFKSRASEAFEGCLVPTKTSLDTAESAVLNPFQKVCVWKKVVKFLGSLPVPLQHVDWKPDYTGCFNKKEEGDGQWHAEIRLTDPYRNIYDQGFVTKKTSRSELCHEFYSTYEFDEFCVADELRAKKIIKFRLCGHTFSWTLLEFAKMLGLYNLEEIEEEGFDVYFQGGLRSDEHFNAQETTGYDKMQKNDLWLLSTFESRHQNGYANVAWLIARWMKRKGAGSQKESMICYGQFITKIAKRINLLTEEVWNGLSASIYCGALDTTTFRELIDSEGRLIPEAPEPGVPRVAIPRPLRASMQYLYERMGSMEIRQEAIERMSYRQSYH